MTQTRPDQQRFSAEDDKLIALARAARARTGAREAAAVRDVDGRTYVATNVELSSLTLTASQAAIAAAVSSGIDQIEAVAVVFADQITDPTISSQSLSAIGELGPQALIMLADSTGTVIQVVSSPVS